MQMEGKETRPTEQITIALAEDPSGALRMLSIDLEVSSLHAVFSARQASTIDRVFNADFARVIRGICLTLAPDTQIDSAPDFCARVSGLLIEGYTLLANTLEDGLRRFTIRFGRVSGNGLALLNFSGRDGDEDKLSPFQSEVLRALDRHVNPDRLFDEMLAHLYLPLVNLNTYMRSVLDGQNACSAEAFSASAVQLKARAENLQFAFDRLLSELMVERVSPPDPVPLQSFAMHEDPAPAPRAPSAHVAEKPGRVRSA